MKRIGNIYDQIYTRENLELADKRAREGKADQYGVKVFDRNREENFASLQKMLIDMTYSTSMYTTFMIDHPKEREIFRLPYFPDRILHHAVMNIIKKVFLSVFTADTYSCIVGRGIHAASYSLRDMLKNIVVTTHCLKIDIRKFYPSVKHEILKKLLRKKFKDWRLLWLLDGIIDSAPGLPIGNYLSQYFANFYLTYFDHWVKEVKGVANYIRYLDDMVFLSESKAHLHKLLADIRKYLSEFLNLELKSNYQVFAVEDRGIDVVGYVHFHDVVFLRKDIKKNFARMLKYNRNDQSIASYRGWLNHCDSIHLEKKLLYETV